MYGYMNIFIKQDQNSIQLCLVLKIEYLLFQHFIFQIWKKKIILRYYIYIRFLLYYK